MEKINKLIYIHIPKTGGWSICNVLDDVGYKNWFNHSSAIEIRDKIGLVNFNNSIKFTVIRNPWDKIKSGYFFFKKRFKYTK